MVMANASSSFSERSEFGLSAETGIATTQFHVHDFMSIEWFTTEPYLAVVDGQICNQLIYLFSSKMYAV